MKIDDRNTFTLFVLLFIFTVLLLTGNASAGEKFDFTKTRDFIKEMEGRPDFPVSTVLAYDYVYSLRTIGETIQPDRKRSVIAYLRGVQQKDGGFAADRTGKAGSSLFTDIALETLAYLESPRELNTEAAKNFILSLKNRDGGFGFSAASRESTIATTYYAVKVLVALNALSLQDTTKTAQFIKAFERNDTGGFGYVKGQGASNAKTTYMAVYTLKSMQQLDEMTAKNTLRFLESTPCGKRSSKKEMPELGEVSYAVQTAKLLKSKDSMDRARIMSFLNRLYIPLNGGFGPIEGYGSTPDSTTTALRILAETGTIKAGGPGLIGMR